MTPQVFCQIVFDQVISINSRGDANLSSDIEARLI